MSSPCSQKLMSPFWNTHFYNTEMSPLLWIPPNPPRAAAGGPASFQIYFWNNGIMQHKDKQKQ